MSEPIPVRVTRYRCPFCARSHSAKRGCREHIGRCWRNPDAHGCMTCKHFDPGAPAEPDVGYPGDEESCTVGVSLAGRSACSNCGGYDEIPCGTGVSADHVGNGRAVKPGPLVGCPQWQPSEAAS